MVCIRLSGKYFVLAGWIRELIKVEEQFFAGLGFSISGDAWVMGNYNSDRRLLSLTWNGRLFLARSVQL